MIKLLLIIWQLPQIILGCIVWLCIRIGCKDLYKDQYLGKIYWKTRWNAGVSAWGISLGPIVIVGGYGGLGNIIRHELGHSVQSQKLGWLYLPVIGSISFSHSVYVRISLFLWHVAPSNCKPWTELGRIKLRPAH